MPEREPPTPAEGPQTAEQLRALLLSFIGSLTLCDHMGDVSDDVEHVLKRLDVKVEWDILEELGPALGKMGVTTLYGSPLVSADDEDTEDSDDE